MTSPMGSDVLRPTSVQVTEAISAPFQIRADLVSTNSTITADSMLFQAVTITIDDVDTPRSFHGVVRSFAATGPASRDYYGYAVEVVPWLWFLGQTEDCRVFQKKSVVDILTTLFQENSITSVSWKVNGTKTVRDYITQFNETDLAFATRLMEDEGYFYFFQQTDSGHTLVVSDDNTAFTTIPSATMTVRETGGGLGTLTGWRRANHTAHGKVSLLDYDPDNPGTLPSGQTTTALSTTGTGARDVFHWPARTLVADDVTARSRRRIEAAEAAAAVWEGIGEATQFYPGGKFTIASDPLLGPSANDGTEYVVRAITHAFTDESYAGGGGGVDYGNTFSAFPSATKWRDPPTTARPVMAGIHAAIVLAPSGEEIYSDSMGRIKVRFFWDHRQDATDSSTCWVRVLQPWTGRNAGWGWQHIPREGAEVAIAFMDGDPDRPVCIGSFFNGTITPVFDPTSDAKTKTGLRTRSTLSGGTSDFSELSFDDKTGNELVFLHAQKDYTTEVEHDLTLKVDNCRIVTITQDETIDVGGKQTITVKSDQSLTVSQGNILTEASAGNITVKADKGNISSEASLGDVSIKATAGNLTIEAAQSITIKCGGSSIKMDPGSITLTAPSIALKADLSLGLKSGLDVAVEGLTSTLKGNAMLTLKGAIAMLN